MGIDFFSKRINTVCDVYDLMAVTFCFYRGETGALLHRDQDPKLWPNHGPRAGRGPFFTTCGDFYIKIKQFCTNVYDLMGSWVYYDSASF